MMKRRANEQIDYANPITVGGSSVTVKPGAI